jgi:chitin synthase
MGMGVPAGEFGTMSGFGYAGSAYGGSGYGAVGPAVPRNSVMTNLNMFGGAPTGGSMGMGGMGFGSMGSATGHSVSGGGFGMQQRPMSTFSMATSINPFMNAPSQNTNPSDEELLNVLRIYLSTQDLMTVTKKCVFLSVSFYSILTSIPQNCTRGRNGTIP